MSFFYNLLYFHNNRNQQLYGEDESLRKKAFDKLLVAFQSELYSKTKRIYWDIFSTNNKEEVEDICHDAFLSLFETLNDPNKRREMMGKKPEGWLVKTAKYKILERKRKKTIQIVINEDAVDIEDDGELSELFDIITDEVKVKKLLQYFDRTDKSNKLGCKEIIEYRFFLNINYKQIAERLNSTEQAIKQTFARCKEKALAFFMENNITLY